jgi:hypothetical protein
VVEETSALLYKDHTELLSSLKDGTIVLATAGSSNVLDTRTGSAEDVVDERELSRS